MSSFSRPENLEGASGTTVYITACGDNYNLFSLLYHTVVNKRQNKRHLFCFKHLVASK